MGLQLKTAIRRDGQEQPGIKLGIFTLRLPLIHFPIEMPEVIQALFMFVTGLSATAFLQDMFDMPFEIALTIVLFHEITYCLHQLLGDPIISGWITSSKPHRPGAGSSKPTTQPGFSVKNAGYRRLLISARSIPGQLTRLT